MTKLKQLAGALLFSSLIVAAGCGDDSEDHDHDHNHETGETAAAQAVACGKTSEAGTAITAAESAKDAHSAVVTASHTPYAITLPASGTGHIHVSTAQEHTTWVIFSDVEGLIAGYILDGSEQPAPTGVAPAACPDDLFEYSVHLHTADDHPFTLQGEGGSTVWFMMLTTGGNTSGDGGHGETGEEDEHGEHDADEHADHG